MTNKRIRELIPRIEHATVRTDIYGNTWVTIEYNRILDGYILTSENEEATREMLLKLKEK